MEILKEEPYVQGSTYQESKPLNNWTGSIRILPSLFIESVGWKSFFFFFALPGGRIYNNLIKWGIYSLVWKSKGQVLTAVCTRVTWVWDILLSGWLSSDSSPGPLHSRPWTCTPETAPPGWLPRVSGLVVKTLHWIQFNLIPWGQVLSVLLFLISRRITQQDKLI